MTSGADGAAYQYLDIPRAEMVEFIPEAARRVLDIGCGLGGFGRELKRRRADVTVVGIESEADAAKIASERYDEVVVGLFPDATPPGRYDCIVFNDVLEHMIDPWQALADAKPLLADDGAIVASIPNLRYWPVLRKLLLAGDFKYTTDGVLDRTHLRFFTRNSIADMVEGAGFAMSQLTPINPMPLNEVPPRERIFLRTLARVKPRFAADVRAQQYAVIAQAKP